MPLPDQVRGAGRPRPGSRETTMREKMKWPPALNGAIHAAFHGAVIQAFVRDQCLGYRASAHADNNDFLVCCCHR
jgi:hypothetical protein